LFGFVQWDSPIALLLEFALALVVFIIAFKLARYVEKRQQGDSPGPGSIPLQSSEDPSIVSEETGDKTT
jgi:hypothetical protein